MDTASLDVRQLEIALDAYSQNSIVRVFDAVAEVAGQRPRKAEMIEMLTGLLGGPRHLQVLERQLSREHWMALSFARLKEEPVMMYALFVRLRELGMGDAEALKILQQLLGFGCLVVVPGYSTSKSDITRLALQRYGPIERSALSFPLLLQRAEEHVGQLILNKDSAFVPAQVRDGTFSELQRETYLALQAAANGQIRLTVKGLPFKADAAKLAAAVAGRTNDALGGASRGKGRGKANAAEPSPRLWFSLSLLASSGLAQSEDGKLRAASAVKQFFRAPAHEQAKALHAAWLGCVFSEFRRIETLQSDYYGDEHLWVDTEPVTTTYDHPNWKRLHRARRTIDRVMRRNAGSAGSWIEISGLATGVWLEDPEFLVSLLSSEYGHSYSQPFSRLYVGIRRRGLDYRASRLEVGKDWPEVEGAYVAQVVVEPLHWLGLVELGLDASGKAVAFRLTPLGRQVLLGERPAMEPDVRLDAPALVVQPNFDLVVLDAEANFGLLAHLDEFAERRSLDRAATYHLTRDSMVRGLDKGLTGASILEILEESTRRPLPQNVRYSIDEWVRLFERVHLRRTTALLEADSPEQMDGWLADPALAPLIGQRVSPAAALVASERRGALVSLLKQREEPPAMIDYALPAKRLFSVEEPASVLVPIKHDDPYLRYRLGCFAELLPAGGEESGELRYRITPESMRGAVAAGLHAGVVERYLVDKAMAKVPADILLRVRGWGGFYKPARQQPVVAIELPPALDWSELLEAVPEIAGLTLRRPGPGLGLVEADKFEALRQALAERGIAFEVGLPAPEPVPPPAPPAPPAPRPSPKRTRPSPMTEDELEDELLDTFDDDLGLGMEDWEPDEAASASIPKATEAEVAPAERDIIERAITRASGDSKGVAPAERHTKEPSVTSAREDAQMVALTELTAEELRSFFDRAILQSRTIFVGAMDNRGEAKAVKLRPISLEQDRGKWRVTGVSPDTGESYTMSFKSILGVANLIEGGKNDGL